ncbi:MAG: AAA family ATPase [Okeania sp. SIO2G4]|uniref:NB-ARC domain-containing protein n=1 Tax=unclassified Okeania TaxID=2634635 RepID=UPI0013BA3A4B|nr:MULTISPECIES: NB-ARC domain-containing protein [unclassified Okeania]NEP06496.1 AAA family ATPase [Okeania sp. SIO4D6]NEP40526.1 AAA family ATPase [Okeania sp. SIO2H7]NEP74310.1 AAA family ATPase [Okeania sp. SIO2G5]NEP96426.1 AAA family ATPase [Okeania sp. SIO2F5]NEQ93121.1 AAA family ATPase [Okeania sp. SIO2G4]
MEYNREAIRKLVTEALTLDGLKDLVFDYFEDVYEDFTQGQTTSQQIRILLQYAYKHRKVNCLLEKIKEKNPKVFNEFESSIRNQSPDKISSSNNLFNIPNIDISEFTGHQDDLEYLESVLLSSQGEKRYRILAIYGLAGTGKSTLAYYFATKYQNEFPDGVISVEVGSDKSLTAIAREFARRFGENMDLNEDLEDDQDAATLMRDLFADRQVLLIFDNAMKDSIEKLLPTTDNKFAAIITTRDRYIANCFHSQQPIELFPLPEEECLQFLENMI